ncbi:hypothetical protein J7384_05460 [Endozoicomonas sp. G2_1]|uniref:5' nucleotidase, NT5C type n=1 Tax=Endozoicomonas sp. G2_1 TaxID=2821091 RepID=UPI001ADB8FC4|nr:hypothetical protein [Endozoicomonas sp. G2_1]MBO9489803.1 hypothetical protein [Endozoicomonas sp. G2_1]
MIVYIDMDDVLCDFSGAFDSALSVNPEITYPQSQYGFYANLTPLTGAIEALIDLLSSEKFTPYILTAPSILNPLCYTEKRIWVEKHLGLAFVERLIISPDKSLLCGDVLIDDRTHGHGQDCFQGELIQFGSTEYPDWESVLNYLKSK